MKQSDFSFLRVGTNEELDGSRKALEYFEIVDLLKMVEM